MANGAAKGEANLDATYGAGPAAATSGAGPAASGKGAGTGNGPAAAKTGAGAGAAAINGAGAKGAGYEGYATAWLIACELYDVAYGKMPPNATDTTIAKTVKNWK